MADFLTFDVVDRPARGAARALLHLARAPLPPGCRGIVPGTTGNFTDTGKEFPYTLRRLGVLAAWTSEDAADSAPLLRTLAEGAREHWHVRGPLGFGTHDTRWRGWEPSPESDRPLPKDQPVVVFISGELRSRHLPEFVRGSIRAAGQAFAAPGYLGGLGFFSSPRNTTSVSAWRTAADSRAFAYKPGAHATAMAADLGGGHHVSQRFLRMRPTRSTGTLSGVNPYDGVAAVQLA
ncbi:hypothetical protein [Nocardioides sp. SYSU DS0651]|uniref:hypothetical protein n=1 Tax=Nocardioides sp. SYSU DS0651 TaxID=3415955 RepID=UPI003F4BDE5A